MKTYKTKSADGKLLAAFIAVWVFCFLLSITTIGVILWALIKIVNANS